MTEMAAPVSTSASTEMPSTQTVSKFAGRAGGIGTLRRQAVSPPKTAAASFPSGCRGASGQNVKAK